MTIKLKVVETIIAFSLLVFLVVWLKKRGILRKEEGAGYAKLLTEIILPAVIFLQLASHSINSRQFLAVLAMFIAGCLSLVLAWGAGKALKLERGKLGALIITSAFGSSSLLGYAMIQFIFPNNPVAMEDAVLISELGVGLPIFILCPAIAMYYGCSEDPKTWFKGLSGYFKSPIFLAVVLGLLASPFDALRNNLFFAPFLESLAMAKGALTFIACLILGLQLETRPIKGLYLLVLISVVIQMLIQPWAAGLLAGWFRLSLEQHEVLVLLSLMPSAVLGTVFATRYNCDGETSAALTFINILLSIFLIPLIFSLLV